MKENAAKALFVVALLTIGVVYGYLATRLHLFPDRLLTTAYKTARDLGRHWQNDVGLVPTRQLNRSHHQGAGVTVANARRTAVISKAIRYDRDYFTVEDWSDCDGAVVAHGNG